MARLSKDGIDRFLDKDVWLEGRTIYLGAVATAHSDEYGVDEISPISAERVIKALQVLDSASSDPIHIVLNSPGGDLYQGFAIYDAIRRCNSEVEILATGQCMSAASIILQAGDVRRASENCLLMVHDGQDGYVGHPKDFAAWAKVGERANARVYEIYAQATKKSAKYWERKCKFDYVLFAEDALQEGLIDAIV